MNEKGAVDGPFLKNVKTSTANGSKVDQFIGLCVNDNNC